MDKSNGYESSAFDFIRRRDLTIGVASVRHWAKTLPAKTTVLDLGCGSGLPISKALMDEGLTVYGIDASPNMVRAFEQNFPGTPVACEAVEDSPFYNRRFDAIVAWGLVFLLPANAQHIALQKTAAALSPGGKLLFTAPSEPLVWNDAVTMLESVSLGAEKYKELLTSLGLSLIEEFEDEGGNHYYSAIKEPLTK